MSRNILAKTNVIFFNVSKYRYISGKEKTHNAQREQHVKFNNNDKKATGKLAKG